MIKLYKIEEIPNKVTLMGIEFAMDLFTNSDPESGSYTNYIFDRKNYLVVEANEPMQSCIAGFLEDIGVTIKEVNFREEHS